jgi:hypothetical protein
MIFHGIFEHVPAIKLHGSSRGFSPFSMVFSQEFSHHKLHIAGMVRCRGIAASMNLGAWRARRVEIKWEKWAEKWVEKWDPHGQIKNE